MRRPLFIVLLALSACATTPRTVPVAASVTEQPCTPGYEAATPNGWIRENSFPIGDGACFLNLKQAHGSAEISVLRKTLRDMSLERYLVNETQRLEKEEFTVTRILPNDMLGRFRLDVQYGAPDEDPEFAAIVIVRTGMPGIIYTVTGNWRRYDAEAGERALEEIVQSLPVTP